MSLCSCDPEKEFNFDCFQHGHSHKARNRILELESENTRLREALDTIAFRSEPKANTPDFWLGLSHEECAETVAEDTECARAALGGGE